MRRFYFLLLFFSGFFVQAQELSNFRIERGEPSRVYFDSNGDLSGLSTQGFRISDKLITGINLSGNYMTVSSAFTFWG